MREFKMYKIKKKELFYQKGMFDTTEFNFYSLIWCKFTIDDNKYKNKKRTT